MCCGWRYNPQMRYLVRPFTNRLLLDAHRELRDAHAFLADLGAKAIGIAASHPSGPGWGGAVKRVLVHFPVGPRPTLVGDVQHHSLAEIINQCATIERLIDAMAWVLETVRQPDIANVLSCNPTASGSGNDNDLVIHTDGEVWRFEISDVVSDSSDGNGKERKDLHSLGFLADKPPPAGRAFLIVSIEFGGYITNRPKSNVQKLIRYVLLGKRPATWIIEVLSR